VPAKAVEPEVVVFGLRSGLEHALHGPPIVDGARFTRAQRA
jgi:hypothetical protein